MRHLTPCCDTDYGRFGIQKKPGSVASFVILRELEPAILENRSTTPSCHDPTGSLVVQLLNL